MARENSLPSDIWTTWAKQGKSTYLKNVKKCVKEKDTNELTRHLYEFVFNYVAGNLKADLLGFLQDLISMHDDIPSLLLDAIYALDSETAEFDDELRQNSDQFIKELEKCLPEALLKERLEIDTLQNVGFLKNKNFRTKLIRIKTKLYYKQKKFNLFREESEGYAKLITELNQENLNNSTHLWEATKALVGCFNLDPNRVIDLILEAIELRPEYADILTELLKNFADVTSVICEILGFKLVHYHSTKGETPRSLYMLAALLLQRQLLTVDQIYPWLMPLDSVIEKEWEAQMNRHRDATKKINSLATNKDKDEPEVEVEQTQDKYVRNQKFGLCEALLNEGAWCLAKVIISRLPPRCALNQPLIARALCNQIHSAIEPLYAAKSNVSSKIARKAAPLIKSPLAPAPVTTFLQLRTDVMPMLIMLGPGLHIDPILIYKIVRLGTSALEELPGDEVKEAPAEDSLYFDVLTLLDSVILPSLSYLDCNCGIAEEIWNIIKHYPYYHRYCLYSRWKNETLIAEDPQLLHKNAEALKLLKNLMKRVSKENIKPIGRSLGKLTHSCPGTLFDYVLIQLQVYDNLIGPIVDSLKFLTSLSYDVLAFCVVETLAKSSNDKSRHKFDGMTISTWLQTLSVFCGAAFKKYTIELTGLLQFVANQLKDKNSLDLLILKEVVGKMAGIEAAEEVTNEQLCAMSGGELLKAEAGYFSQVRNTKKSSQRLKEALNEQDLGASLCLLMAQQRHCVVYRDAETTHLKHVGKLYDQCQDTLVQFGTFLCSSLTVDEYVSKFPSFHSMLSEYHIGSDVAFFLARPTLNHAINMKYDALRKSDPDKKLKIPRYCEAVDLVLTPLVESVRSLHPTKIWEEISPRFVVTFWSLTMYDLEVPVKSYQKEINKIKVQARTQASSKEMAGNKGKKEMERFNAMMEKLQEEKTKQTEHVEKIMARLKIEKKSWIPSKTQKTLKNESVMQFLQLCILPRCLFTASDAVFCAKFIGTIHALRTENFPTVLCIDKLLCDITYTVTMCTENEAHRYGRFLCSLLEMVIRWHSNVTVFNAECLGTPGFDTRFRSPNKDEGKQITFEPYRGVCHKWYYRITRAMMFCFNSGDFNQIRNTIIVLIKVLPHFPLLARLAQVITKRIEKIMEEEKTNRPDLYILATSYYGQLKAKTSSLILESDFYVAANKEVKKPKEVKEVKEVPAKEVKEVVVGDSEKRVEKKEPRDKGERREVKVKTVESPSNRERVDKDKEKEKAKEAHRERARERKEEKHAAKEERAYRDERYVEKEDRYVSSSVRDDNRYSGKDEVGRYSGGSAGGYYADNVHYYDETRDLSSVSNSSPRSIDNMEMDRDVKRRKVEASSSKSHRSPEWVEPVSSSVTEKSEKKERSSRSKDKPLRKKTKSTRKRERHPEDESPPPEVSKSRKDDDLVPKSQNGNSDMMESSHRSKRSYTPRDRTPVYERERERERSHDKAPLREKQLEGQKGPRGDDVRKQGCKQ